MQEQAEALTRHGLTAFAGLFPKHNPEMIKDAMAAIEADLSALEAVDPDMALHIAQSVRKLTEGLNA